MKKKENFSIEDFVNSVELLSNTKMFGTEIGGHKLTFFITNIVANVEPWDVNIEVCADAGDVDYYLILQCLRSGEVKEYLDKIMPATTGKMHGVWNVHKISERARTFTLYNKTDKVKIGLYRSVGIHTPRACLLSINMTSKTSNRQNLIDCLVNDKVMDFAMRILRKTFRPRKEDKL